MNMLCEKCNKNIASVYIKNIINGKTTENYLCASCANETYNQNKTEWLNWFENDMISEVFNFNKIAPGMSTGISACPLCGSTLASIKQSGKVGCGECYRTFRSGLEPNIMRIHGRTNHIGKIPKNMYLKISNKRKTEELKVKLKKMIDEQNFEEAAVIRDEINKLDKQEQEGVV